jgi:hypothetical protein
LDFPSLYFSDATPLVVGDNRARSSSQPTQMLLSS